MLQPFRLLALSGVVAIAAAHAEPPLRSHNDLAGEPALKVEDASVELKRTYVTPYFTQEVEAGRNYLWCATFQLAWDEFTKGGPVTFEGSPVAAVELSKHPFPKDALDKESYVAMSGVGPQTIDAIKAELERAFKGAASPSVLPDRASIRPHDLVAYAYLFKNLEFETPFSKMPHGLHFNSGGRNVAQVAAFGILDETKDRYKAAAQVIVHHYIAKDDFVIELTSKAKGDRLIIARLKRGATLRDTAEAAVKKTTDAPETGFRNDDSLTVPVLNFDITRSYKELTGIPTAGDSPRVTSISSALQNIRFRLDEHGAILKSDAVIVAPTSARGGPAERPAPRFFVCDGPFLVLMQREGATTPYFAAWIENPELLVPHK